MEEETAKINGNPLALFIIFYSNDTRNTMTAAQRFDKSKTYYLLPIWNGGPKSWKKNAGYIDMPHHNLVPQTCLCYTEVRAMPKWGCYLRPVGTISVLTPSSYDVEDNGWLNLSLLCSRWSSNLAFSNGIQEPSSGQSDDLRCKHAYAADLPEGKAHD